MKKQLLALLIILCSGVSFAQIKYAQPADIIGDGYKIIISEIESEKDNTSFEITFYNTSRNEYLAVDPLKIGVTYDGLGTYYFNSKMALIGNQKFVIAPGDKKNKNIKVVGDFDHKHESIQIEIDGLRKGNIPESALAVAPLQLKDGSKDDFNTDDFFIEFSKVSTGKNNFVAKGELEIPENNEDTYLIFFDEKAAKATGADGAALDLKVSINNNTPIDTDTDKNITLEVEQPISEMTVNWGNSFKKIDLTEIAFEPIEVTDVKSMKPKKIEEPKPVETKEPVASKEVPTFKMCDPVVNSTRAGDMTIKIVSSVGCFKVYMDGELMNDEFTSSLSFKNSPGFYPAKIVMETGELIEKKLAIGEDYKLAYYNIKEKKGEYVIKLSLGSSQPKDEVVPLTETTFAPDEITCKDQIFVEMENWTYIKNVTVVGITRSHVRYVSCDNPGTVQQISKTAILQIEYANDSYDNFDFDGGSKQGMGIVRSRDDVYQRHTPGVKPGQSTSSIVIGPPR